jgi:hypothetical protein
MEMLLLAGFSPQPRLCRIFWPTIEAQAIERLALITLPVKTPAMAQVILICLQPLFFLTRLNNCIESWLSV